MLRQAAADFQENQRGQRQHREHFLQHAKQARQHHGEQNGDRQNSKEQDKRRICHRGDHLAAHLILMFEQAGQIGHDLGQYASLLADANHAGVKFAEQFRLLRQRRRKGLTFAHGLGNF